MVKIVQKNNTRDKETNCLKKHDDWDADSIWPADFFSSQLHECGDVLSPWLHVSSIHVILATASADKPNVVAAFSKPFNRWISIHVRSSVSLRSGNGF